MGGSSGSMLYIWVFKITGYIIPNWPIFSRPFLTGPMSKNQNVFENHFNRPLGQIFSSGLRT